jgi:hypothetical protein
MGCASPMHLFSDLQRADILAISSALVAAASFFVSYLSYRRDQGRLDVKVGIWQEMNLQTGVMGNHFIRISAVNSGRRPIVADSVGAFPRWQRPKRILNRLFPKLFKPVGFFISDPLVIKELTDQKTGKFRVLAEGESIQISLPLAKVIPANSDWSKMHEFYVGDTTGREHRAKRKALRKFVRDLKEYAEKSAERNASGSGRH